MRPLTPPDTHHLLAAQGWIELGNHLEANEELENITAENRAHPAVLEVRWQIYAQAEKWKGALDIASALIQLVPEHPLGWIHQSYSLHELKRTEEARDNLLGVVEKSPQDPIMRYNLACYECQLGQLEQAKHWLRKAFEVGDSKKIKLMALEDPDLEPLWREIGKRCWLGPPDKSTMPCARNWSLCWKKTAFTAPCSTGIHPTGASGMPNAGCSPGKANPSASCWARRLCPVSPKPSEMMLACA
jgi:tetratricopeptide (TPR) repeat protein